MENEGINSFLKCLNKELHKPTGYFIIMVNKSRWQVLSSMQKDIIFFTQEEAENYMYGWQSRNNFAPAYVKAMF